MTTSAKIAVAAVIVAALGAVVGYDLMYGGKKSPPGADAAPNGDSGLTVIRDNSAPPSPADLIHEAERREAGTGAAKIPTPAPENDRPPYTPPSTPVDPVPSNEEYVVKAGETMADIAERKYGDPNKWSIIAKANAAVNPNRMKIGTKLILPSPSAAVPADPAVAEATREPEAPPADGSPRTYVIQAGDVLSKIAKRFYGSAAAVGLIKDANPDILRDPDVLSVGAKLLIPEAPAKKPVTVTSGQPGATHTTEKVDPAVATRRTHAVARGDSLWKIAEKHHGGQGVLTFMDRLVSANSDKLASKETPLRAGWILAIPDPE